MKSLEADILRFGWIFELRMQESRIEYFSLPGLKAGPAPRYVCGGYERITESAKIAMPHRILQLLIKVTERSRCRREQLVAWNTVLSFRGYYIEPLLICWLAACAVGVHPVRSTYK
jgi:hypothetical protein